MIWADWLTLGIYFVFLLVIGLYFQGKNKNVSDYFRGGCQATWWLTGTSIFMTTFTAWTFTGAAGVAFNAGWSVIIIFLANATGLFINFAVVAPLLRQARAITAPEVMRNRFNTATQQFLAYIAIPVFLLFSALSLYGLAIFCSAVFGMGIIKVILMIGIVVVVYSTVGGLWGVMSTDFLQGLILFPLTVALAVLCLHQVHGVSGFFDAIQAAGLSESFRILKPSGAFPKDAYTWKWAAAIFGYTLIQYNTLTSGTRYFCVKDGPSARKASLLACVLTLIGTSIWFIPSITSRLLYAEQVQAMAIAKPAEAAYAVASMHVLPLGLTGLMVVAMFAATMSSMSTGLNGNAAMFTQDIYPMLCQLCKVEPKDYTHRVAIGRWFTLFLGAMVVSLAVYFSRSKQLGLFEMMLSVLSLLVTPLSIPALLGLFVKKVPSYSAIVSICCSLSVSAVSMFSESLGMEPWTMQKNVMFIIMMGTASFFLCKLGWKRESESYKKKSEEFFKQLHTPVNYKEEVGVSTDHNQLKVMGNISCILAGLIGLMIFYPNPLIGRITILGLSGTVGVVGVFLLLSARRMKLRGES